MSGWGGGYVTDVTYLAQHYPEQSPHMLAAACVVSGVDPGFTGEAPGLHYLELGCGRGMNALVVAAGNPRWRVTAIDFTPAAIAEGRRTAAAAGLENITFIEADLAGFAETVEARALPEADFVSMHGVWSWVPVAVRAGIVRLLAAKLRAGGVVHVSYNVLPGLQGALGMQRLIRAAGGALAQRSDRQVLAGRQVVMDLVAAEALHLRTPVVTELLRHLEKAPVEYLAHEFMNATWAPCFQADVAEALADAKLELVASAKLPENFLGLMLAPAQIAVLERFDDPRLRELVKDICVDRALRHDVYVRGPQRLDRAVQDSLLRGMTLALTVLPGNFAYQIEMPAGRATLGEGFYGPAVAALAFGPRQVGELMTLPGQTGSSDNPAELVAMLVGTGQAALLPWPDAAPSGGAMRLNAVLARQVVRLDGLNRTTVAASARMGGGLVCRAVELFLLERIAEAGGGLDPGGWALELAPDLPVEDLNVLRGQLQKVVEDRLPIWRSVGAI
ncbi:MAG: class I SAM-dependent methyltransferase [Rhodospirillales bacterium]|nr:class I SAM-dependent methyltransferase [Rhodospirillales bacterium]